MLLKKTSQICILDILRLSKEINVLLPNIIFYELLLKFLLNLRRSSHTTMYEKLISQAIPYVELILHLHCGLVSD